MSFVYATPNPLFMKLSIIDGFYSRHFRAGVIKPAACLILSIWIIMKNVHSLAIFKTTLSHFSSLIEALYIVRSFHASLRFMETSLGVPNESLEISEIIIIGMD